jgi:hypothetical protein
MFGGLNVEHPVRFFWKFPARPNSGMKSRQCFQFIRTDVKGTSFSTSIDQNLVHVISRSPARQPGVTAGLAILP